MSALLAVLLLLLAANSWLGVRSRRVYQLTPVPMSDALSPYQPQSLQAQPLYSTHHQQIQQERKYKQVQQTELVQPLYNTHDQQIRKPQMYQQVQPLSSTHHQKIQQPRKYQPVQPTLQVQLVQPLADHQNGGSLEEEAEDQNYKFGFHISDEDSHNFQERQERREGGVVQGYYSLMEADGSLRLVTYTADHAGFRALVATQQQAEDSLSAAAPVSATVHA